MKQNMTKRYVAPKLEFFISETLQNHREFFLGQNPHANELDFLESILEIYKVDYSDYIRTNDVDIFDDKVYKSKRIIEYLQKQVFIFKNIKPAKQEKKNDILKEDKTIGFAQKKILTLKEAALYSGFSKSFLYKCTSKNVFKFSKPNGKTIFIDKEDFENWLLSRKNKTQEDIEKEALNYCVLSKKKGTRHEK